MIFHFIKSCYISSDNFEMDIPVSFVIPKSFKSFQEMGILVSNNKEIRDVLDNLGVTSNIRYSFGFKNGSVVVNIRKQEFQSIKKILLRDKLLKELVI